MINISELKIGDIIEEIYTSIRYHLYNNDIAELIVNKTLYITTVPPTTTSAGAAIIIKVLKDETIEGRRLRKLHLGETHPIYQEDINADEEIFVADKEGRGEQYVDGEGWMHYSTYRKLDDVETITELL